MSERNIVERLRTLHEKRENQFAWREVIRTYEQERKEAADEIERLGNQLSVAHASASDTEYHQWERIRAMEAALGEMLQVLGKPPILDGSVNSGACDQLTREVINRARAALNLAD